MVNVNKLRGAIAENRLTMRETARRIGMAQQTLARKMERGVFDSEDMDALIELLDLENPAEIFLVPRWALQPTNQHKERRNA